MEGVGHGRAPWGVISEQKTTASVVPRVHGGALCRRVANLARAQRAPGRAVPRKRGTTPHEGERERGTVARSQKKTTLSTLSGSHTVLALLDSGYTATIFDNLDNSFEAVFDRMKELAGDKADKMKFVKVRRRRGRKGKRTRTKKKNMRSLTPRLTHQPTHTHTPRATSASLPTSTPPWGPKSLTRSSTLRGAKRWVSLSRNRCSTTPTTWRAPSA